MKKYEIWIEGYAITGNSSNAIKFGEAEGKDFKDAVATFFKDRDDSSELNKDKTSYWGCRLFDNETDARRSFG